MRHCRSPGFAKLRLLQVAFLSAAASGSAAGCTTYSDLDVDGRPDSHAPIQDSAAPPMDRVSIDMTTPPVDMGPISDNGVSVDIAIDLPRDAPASEVNPPADVMAPDAGRDAS